MPPATAPLRTLPPPTNYDDLAVYEFFQSMGLFPRITTIRSNDFGLINRCRFLYLIQRRYGLVPAFSMSEALSRGSWIHKAAEKLGDSSERIKAHVEAALKDRLKEISAIGAGFNLSAESTARFRDTETEDALSAMAWFMASTHVRILNNTQLADGYLAYFMRKCWVHLGHELRLIHVDETYPKSPLVIECDKLLYNKDTNKLWLVEFKTCPDSTVDRAQVIRLEYQPLHYIYVTQCLLDSGELQKTFDLPANVKLGGVIHVLLRKPSIRFGQLDRPFHWANESKRSKLRGVAARTPSGVWAASIRDIDASNSAPAVNKAEFRDVTKAAAGASSAEERAKAWLEEQVGTQVKKAYSGEPDLALYTKRCIDWYTAKGDYEEKKDEWASDPTVNLSTTQAEAFQTSRNLTRYHTQLKRVYEYATIRPYLGSFDATSDGMLSRFGNSLSSYAPFYTVPPAQWGDVINQRHFIQLFRDEDIDIEDNVHVG